MTMAIVLTIIIIVAGIPALMMIVDNTKALRKEKELRGKLEQLIRDMDALHAGDVSMADALNRRASMLRQEIEEWQRSPWVVAKPK